MRRLTRAELGNTFRDLLGTRLRPGEDFPADESDHGFDTNADALSVAQLHAEALEGMVRRLVDELFARAPEDPVRRLHLSCAGGQPSLQDGCVREILGGFAGRAVRRPADEHEVDRLVALYGRLRPDAGSDQAALQAAMRAVLLSPHFLFRVEVDRQPGAAAPYAVTAHELATRLSYFLWSSMPDEALLASAASGKLTGDRDELGRQVARMLADQAKLATGLVQNFAGQWLLARRIEGADPSLEVYPSFDEPLRAAMAGEAERFFQALIAESAPVERLLSADFTFVNDRLAGHYGLPRPGGNALARVPTAGTARGGLLTQGGFLLVTSDPARTSPIKRGVAVLEQLLCTTPPPVPDNVEGFEAPRRGEARTLRAALEAHRANPECAGCHVLIDPLGWGMENYDGIGAWRALDNGLPVDASGVTVEGRRYDGVRELAATVASDERYLPCMTQQALAYALGRSFSGDEAQKYAAGLAARARAQGGTLPAVIAAVARSEAFSTRRGGAAP